MDKSLLQEAIAEAKQVRAAAIKNATKQLEENLTPSIKEMLAKKLEEELDLDESEEESLEESADSGFKEVKVKSTVKEAEDDEEPKDDENSDSDEDAAADDEAPADDSEEAVADKPADDEAPADPAADDSADASEEADDETPLKDITLGDLKALVADLVSAASAPAPGGDLGADLEAGDVEGMGDEAPAGDIANSDEAPVEDPAAAEVPADDESAADDDEIDISEILKELEEEEKKGVCPECGRKDCICKENKANDIQPENQNGKEHHKEFTSGPSQDDEIKELKQENQELRESLEKCVKSLRDTNLINSKLLYTTRILNKENLTESQKTSIIKSLDEAKNPKEVKSLYKTLLEGIQNSKTVLKESRRGSASRAAGNSTASNVIVESNDMVRRFQQLAGIIKD